MIRCRDNNADICLRDSMGKENLDRDISDRKDTLANRKHSLVCTIKGSNATKCKKDSLFSI